MCLSEGAIESVCNCAQYMAKRAYKRTTKMCEKKQIISGQYSFDYIKVPLCSNKEITSISSRQGYKPSFADTNDYRYDFKRKLQFAVANESIQQKLERIEISQLSSLICCDRLSEKRSEPDVRRRCFCDSLGPKYCDTCRRKVKCGLIDVVPKIMEDLRPLPSVETAERKHLMHLKRASMFYDKKGYEDTKVETDLTNCQHVSSSRTSSFSSIIQEITPPIFSSNIEETRCTSVDSDDPKPLTLPAISRSSIIPYLPQHSPSISSSEEDDSTPPDIFHTTQQLRSIKELRGGMNERNNETTRSNVKTSEENCTIRSFSSGKNSNSLEDYKRKRYGKGQNAVCKLSHPIEPVLLDLKYINFSIYDYA